MQARRNQSSYVITPKVDNLRILEVYGDLETAENDTRFRSKFRMLFTTNDVIEAFSRRSKIEAGEKPPQDEEDVQEEVNMAHKDAIRNHLTEINDRRSQEPASDPKEIVNVWYKFVQKHKRFQIVQDHVTGKFVALKIIRDLDQSKEIESAEEPFKLGELTNWGGLEVGIIEARYQDRFVCLETPAEMLEAYNSQNEIEDLLKLETMQKLYNPTIGNEITQGNVMEDYDKCLEISEIEDTKFMSEMKEMDE